MPLDPYVSCPCGSGKKFKWCCAPYYPQVERAFGQARLGQHEAALQTIRDLTKTHAEQPAVWNYFAQFLYNTAAAQPTEEARHKMIEEAEDALAQALKLNPNFGRAHYLRGMFRLNEGEVIGALILFRKAAEAYDSDAHEQLAEVHELIFRHEFMLNRVVAARAALERTIHFAPGETQLREDMEGLFGDLSNLPPCARKKYTLRPTAKPIATAAITGKLSDARKAYETLTQVTPADPAAWFNLGVVLAWLGDNPRAIEALERSIIRETDDHRAEEAGALAEVLRCGTGMENDADYLDHGFVFPIRDAGPIMQWLQGMAQTGRLVGIQQDQEAGAMSAMMIEALPNLLAVGGITLARVVAKIHTAQGGIRFWHPDGALVSKVAAEFRVRVHLAVEQGVQTRTPIAFGDVALEAIVYPTQNAEIQLAEEKVREHARHFFEEVWAHRPRKSLAGNALPDAAANPALRKRAFGVIKFIEDCYLGVVPMKQVGQAVVPMQSYDFANLRQKLGLEYVSAPPPDIQVPEEPAPAPAAVHSAVSPPAAITPHQTDIAALTAGELAALDVAALSVIDLEKAMRAALKLDARDLAVAFAQAGLLKPFDPAAPDRYPLYATAITGAVSAGSPEKAIAIAADGQRYDAEHNGGNRAVDFGLKTAQLHVRMKDVDGAVAAFDGLIAKHPDEGKFYTTAAEEMLRMKNGARALYFAEKGLAKARSLGNRDLEGHCLELQDAARRAG